MAKAAPTPRHYGTGRRKSSVARVYIKPGTGNFVVNGRAPDVYFERATTCLHATGPLTVAELEGKIDVSVNVHGGGKAGQAGATQHGLSRALVAMDPELRTPLKRAGLLTRDARIKERKKYGQPGARKQYQFSKR